MYRVLIWGCGYYYSQYINAIKYQEMLGDIKVTGVTGRDELYACLDGYPFIPFRDIEPANVDYIVVTAQTDYHAICAKVKELGFASGRILLARVFCLPMFRFQAYATLLDSRVSIIANNCWGGTAYHALGMRFLSPFINMFEEDGDYLRLLGDLQGYLGEKLRFERFGYSMVLKREYPVCSLGDVELHFNHAAGMEEVENKWYERVGRINWDNLFIMMFTEDKNTVKEFDRLHFQKKVCFVPFQSRLKSVCRLQTAGHKEMEAVPFWEITNKTASGHLQDYDLVKMLLEGVPNHDRYYIEKCAMP